MHDAPTATRLQLGQEIEQLRRRAGMNTTQAASLIGIKRGTFRRYELGETTIPYAQLELLLLKWALTDDTETQRLLELRAQADQPVWWSKYSLEQFGKLLGFESMTRNIRVYEPSLVFGPLQTEDYARAIIHGTTGDDAATVEKKVGLRMERQQRTYLIEDPPELRVILDEPVIRRRIGGASVMSEQLGWLASLTEPCELRILPLQAAPHPGMTGAFYIFDFDSAVRPSAIYVESYLRNLYLDSQKDVERASVDFEHLWEAALDSAASRRLIDSVIEEMNL